MKLFLLSVFGIGTAMTVATPTVGVTLEKHLTKLGQILEKTERMLDNMLSEANLGSQDYSIDDSEFAPCKVDREPKNGLKTVKVVGSSLQPSCSVQSGARGLTPEDEWRRMFPHPVGYSR